MFPFNSRSSYVNHFTQLLKKMQKTEITIKVTKYDQSEYLWLNLKFDSERAKKHFVENNKDKICYLGYISGNSKPLKIRQIDQYANENLKIKIHLEILPEIYLSCNTKLHKNPFEFKELKYVNKLDLLLNDANMD